MALPTAQSPVGVLFDVDGTLVDTVEVLSAVETVQTSTSGNYGNLISSQAVKDLPIVGTRGRNPLDLVITQPGVVSGSNTGGGIHVNGARDRSWNYTLDGIDVNDSSQGGSNTTSFRVNPDMLEEMRIVRAKELIAQMKLGSSRPLVVDNPQFHAFKARVSQLPAPPPARRLPSGQP